MTHVPASSHGSTFNGGTITAPLTVDLSGGDPGVPAVYVKIPGHALASPVLQVDDTGVRVSLVVADGYSYLQQDANPGHFGQSLITSGALAITGDNLEDMVTVSNHLGAAKVAIGEATLGLYGHAAAAQSSVTSGTVTPEQLALGLQANGTLGGS